MAEARAMVQADAYHPHARVHPRIYGRLQLWKTGDSPGQVAMAMGRAIEATFKSRMRRFRQFVTNFIFPIPTKSLYVSIGAFAVMEVASPDKFALLAKYVPFQQYMPNKNARSALCYFVLGTSTFILASRIARTSLRLALRYHGYLYDPIKKVSLKTRIWAISISFLEWFARPGTYSFQSVLPTLPVPSLSDTCSRYLASMRPLLDDAQYDRICRLAEEFQHQEGRGFQRWLKLKSWFFPNYVTDWWETYVYLAPRSPIMINSNYYIMDAYEYVPTTVRAARVGNITHKMVQYMRQLKAERLEPIIMQRVVPLDMATYPRTFGTSRIPGVSTDTIQTVSSRHLAVYCKGHWFLVHIDDKKGNHLTARDFERQYAMIEEEAAKLEAGYEEKHLAALTAIDRTTWAHFRNDHMARGVTRASLDAIERAAFVVILDDSTPSNPSDNMSEKHEVGSSLLHGNGFNRWFDKSICLIGFANGRIGFNCEHSWADAPVAAQVLETALAREFATAGYDHKSGCNKALPEDHRDLPRPQRLHWVFEADARPIIEDAVLEAQKKITDLDLRCYPHRQYSKGFMKVCGTSPDAWLQTALQLAYYRDQGHFSQTYEASMTRLFKHGRTETVRSVTDFSCAFVLAMEDPTTTLEERRSLLKQTTTAHVKLFKDAMTGKGVDRHLFCLYVVSQWREKQSPFLEEVLSTPWLLSTSQTPVQQTRLFDLANNLDMASAGGGFGPVHDDGYGVSYIVSSDAMVSFHVSCKKSSSKTDATRFVGNIVQAMEDIKNLFPEKLGYFETN
eukprot:m.354327 g.354327  ORF g.354327 m.354327 type:complete len:789 (+) comp16984_c0_seq1:187-2553(+)